MVRSGVEINDGGGVNHLEEIVWVLALLVCVVLFAGEPDLHDALVAHFMPKP